MRIKYKTKTILIAIMILGFLLRVWKIAVIPIHLTADEAAFGYNAYSILKTGKDIHGDAFPLIFKSFGDNRPGLYFYLTALSVRIFGLNEFAVRIPNVIISSLAILAVFLLIKTMTKNSKLALLGSFILSINPWHIFFSRGAWEPSVSLTLTIFGIYFFLRSFDKGKDLIYSSIFFGLTLLTYQGSKLASLIVLVILLLVYSKKLLKVNKRYLLFSAAIGAVIASPVLYSMLSGSAGRLQVVSIFSYERPFEQVKQLMENEGINYFLYHNNFVFYFSAILGRFFNHFSPRFLFFEGEWQNIRHSIPNHGMLLYIEAAFFVSGVVYIIKDKIKKHHIFIFLWLILSVFPSIFTRDEVHAVRSISMIVPLVIIEAYGLYFVINHKKLFSLASTLLIFNYIYFLDAYFVHLNEHNAEYWYYGHKQSVKAISDIPPDSYDKIIVNQSYDQPFIYFLFYQKTDPTYVQENLKFKDDKLDVGLVERLGNIYFKDVSWYDVKNEKNTVVMAPQILLPEDLVREQENSRIIEDVNYPNRKGAFRIIKVE